MKKNTKQHQKNLEPKKEAPENTDAEATTNTTVEPDKAEDVAPVESAVEPSVEAPVAPEEKPVEAPVEQAPVLGVQPPAWVDPVLWKTLSEEQRQKLVLGEKW